MGVEIWINQDPESGEYYIMDRDLYGAVGPIEVTNELFERIMEHEREHQVIQDILDSLQYDWQYEKVD